MNISTRGKNLFFVLLIPLLAGIVVRVIALNSWWASPFRYYSYVSGLDMQTILNIGFQFYQEFATFTLYKFTIAVILWFTHGSHCSEALIIIQMLMGIGIALMVSWLALRLTGKRLWAALSGLLAALYAPGLMYECFVLKEIYLIFFSLLALAAVIWGRKRHFSRPACFIVGIIVALPCLCRVTALPFVILAGFWLLLYCLRRWRKGGEKLWRHLAIRALYFAAGVVILLVPVSVFNYFNTNGNTLLPFDVNVGYAISLGKIKNPTTLNPNAETLKRNTDVAALSTESCFRSYFDKTVSFTTNFLRKVPLVFLPYEIPNNLNYYFVRSKLFPLSYLPGPLLLLPLVVTALLLIIFAGRFVGRESLLLFYIIAFTIPICFFYPLARYRLVLYPIFSLLAPYPIFFAIRSMKQKKLLKSLAPLLIFTPIFLLSMPDINLRNEDFIAYGKALKKQDGNLFRAISYFRAAYHRAPHYQAAIVNYTDALLQTGQAERATTVINAALTAKPEYPPYLYYAALAAFFSRSPAQAERLFKELSPAKLDPKLRVIYHYYLGESLRLQKKYNAAVIEYQKGMVANPTEAQQELLIEAMNRVPH